MMRFSRKLICLLGFAGVAGTSLTMVRGEQPATDARSLESAVDRLGMAAAGPELTNSATGMLVAAKPKSSVTMAARSSRPAQTGAAAKPAPQASAGRNLSRAKVQSEALRRSSKSPRKPVTSADTEDDAPLPEEGEGGLVDPVATAADLSPVEADPGDELTSEQIALRNRVRKALGIYFPKRLNTRDHNPWEMMHGIIAFGVDTQIRRGGPDGQPVNAIAYLSANGRMNGIQLLFNDNGRINAQKGVKVQGHYGQLLAILAQSRVKADYPLRVGEQEFTLADLIETEQRTCRAGIELTFKLISFAHYLDSDATWTNETGEAWDIPKLIAEELKQPILSNAACGGTHRLMGFAYAVRNRKKQNRPIEGQWKRAETYLDDYHKYTFALQNADGSFSTEWFRRREAKDDINRRLQTTGHILEWMSYSLPEQQLDDPRLVKAVAYLTNILLAEPNREWEIGPLGHAVHALSIYDQRRYKPLDAVSVDVARRNAEATAERMAIETKPAVKAAEEAIEADSDADADSGPSLLFQR